VNVNQAGSGTQLTAMDLFSFLGIKVEEVNMRQNDAFEKLKNGEIAATVALTGKPSREIAKLKSKEGFRILPIPFDKRMLGDFAPTMLTHEDYPDLIAADQTVETVASGTVMIAYNWPKNTDRYRRLDKFVKPSSRAWRNSANPRGTRSGTTRSSRQYCRAGSGSRAPTNGSSSRVANRSMRGETSSSSSWHRAMSRPEACRRTSADRLFEEFLKWSSTRY